MYAYLISGVSLVGLYAPPPPLIEFHVLSAAENTPIILFN